MLSSKLETKNGEVIHVEEWPKKLLWIEVIDEDDHAIGLLDAREARYLRDLLTTFLGEMDTYREACQ